MTPTLRTIYYHRNEIIFFILKTNSFKIYLLISHKPRKNLAKTPRKPLKNPMKTPGKPQENPGKNLGKPRENPGKSDESDVTKGNFR